MKRDVLVTIITVCYNSEKTIRRTMESVLEQTYTNIEYIIIDGKSLDTTMQIVRELAPLFGERIKIVSESDKGIYDAMNKGVKLAKGELIGIINSDDYYEKDAVENIVNSWDRKPGQILHGLMRQLKDGKEYGVILTTCDFLYEKMIQHPSCFVTKDVYEKIGLFDTQYRCVADMDFMIRAYESEKVSFKPVYHVIANFCEGGMSDTAIGKMEKIKYLKKRGKISLLSYLIMSVFVPLKSKVYKKIWN